MGHVLNYHGDGTFHVKYVLDNQVEKKVRIAHLKSLNPLATSAWQMTNSQLQHPLLMSPLHWQLVQLSNLASSVLSSGPTDVTQVGSSSFSWSPNDVEDNPQLKHLKDGIHFL
jgi:hypothetical protein